MRIVGLVTTAGVAAVALFGVLVGIRSVPDIKRYLKMRQM